VKLTVAGGMAGVMIRKRLILTFQCARTKAEVTTETSDWGKWLKIGFSAISLGKCVADVAGGDVSAIASGVGCVQVSLTLLALTLALALTLTLNPTLTLIP
jgi:hypothetical protein